MKMHSDSLTKTDVQDAAFVARHEYGQDIYVDEMISCGSRSRRYGTMFRAYSLNGKRMRDSRAAAPAPAASWTAYGYLIAELFRRDPNAIIGCYKGADDFRDNCTRYVPSKESNEFLSVLNQ